MSSYEPKDMTGAMFKNNKDGNEKRPDYKGDILINGEKFRLSGWLKQPNDPSKPKFLSLKAEPFQATGSAPRRADTAATDCRTCPTTTGNWRDLMHRQCRESVGGALKCSG